MATNATLVGIKNAWTLLAFAKTHGRMQVGSFIDKETGECFKSTIFTADDGTCCFVSFSSNLGALTPAEISALKYDLQVVELETGTFKLCKQGTNSWEDVEL